MSLEQADLQCIICTEYLSSQIYQCANGPHYICGECLKKKNECPICRNGQRMICNTYLSGLLKPHLIACPYVKNGCQTKIFSCDDSHIEECKHAHAVCPLCKVLVKYSENAILDHLQSNCDFRTHVINYDNYMLVYYETNQHWYVGCFSDDQKLTNKIMKVVYRKGTNKEIFCELPIITNFRMPIDNYVSKIATSFVNLLPHCELSP